MDQFHLDQVLLLIFLKNNLAERAFSPSQPVLTCPSLDVVRDPKLTWAAAN